LLISKLPFLSNLLEKVEFGQIHSFLDLHGIHEVFQSGFSTETALMKVFKDLLLTTSSWNCAILILLDLSAAFDTVDHKILITHLEQCVGIKGTALAWFSSYLSD